MCIIWKTRALFGKRELHVVVDLYNNYIKYIMNIIIYLRSTITEMRDSEASTRDCGTNAFCGTITRNMGWLAGMRGHCCKYCL